jgi:hypothetical protein
MRSNSTCLGRCLALAVLVGAAGCGDDNSQGGDDLSMKPDLSMVVDASKTVDMASPDLTTVDLTQVDQSSTDLAGADLTPPPPFVEPPVKYPTGMQPYAVATRDLNGDGLRDLVVSNSNGFMDSTVSVLINSGNSFMAAVSYPAGIGPTSLAIGNFNNDLHPDIAVADDGAGVDVLINNGDGTFGAATSFAAGAEPNGLATADFDRDGNADLVTANLMGDNASVLKGDGMGGFVKVGDFDVGGVGTGPIYVTVGDFNGDGYADFVTCNLMTNTIAVVLNKANNTISFNPATTLATGATPISATLADLDGDGKLDIAVANLTAGSISVFQGMAAGAFAPGVLVTTQILHPAAITTSDFDRDGSLDLVISGDNYIEVRFGDGKLGFSRAISAYAGTGPTAITAADFNGDNKPDVAVADNGANNSVNILINNMP